MASDQRWTGGIANRDWSAGHAPARDIPAAQLASGVKAYLADCDRHRAMLSPAYHPTAGGACKAVYHAGTREAEFIRSVFAGLAGQPAPGAEARDA
ncbi:MAG TPA: hypothetical protein VH478_04285 [Trebonia sp.]|nr:hypothetical protein [Trebonia sp.]